MFVINYWVIWDFCWLLVVGVGEVWLVVGVLFGVLIVVGWDVVGDL